jgi:hypothetical protein
MLLAPESVSLWPSWQLRTLSGQQGRSALQLTFPSGSFKSKPVGAEETQSCALYFIDY